MDRIKKAKKINFVSVISNISLFIIIIIFGFYNAIQENPNQLSAGILFFSTRSIVGYFGIIASILFYRIVDIFILIPEIKLTNQSDEPIKKSKAQIEIEMLEEALKQDEE